MMLMTGVAALAAADFRSRRHQPNPKPQVNPRIRALRPPTPIPLPRSSSSPTTSTDRPAHRPTWVAWTVVGWNEPVTPPILGLFRDDRRNVSLDGNGNLVLRATREGDTYFSGRVETKMKIGIGHTWEARIKLNCLVPGCWPAYWLVNRRADAGRQGSSARRRSRHPRVVRQRQVGSGHLGPRSLRRQDLEGEPVARRRRLAHLPGPVGRRRLSLLAGRRRRRPVLHGCRPCLSTGCGRSTRRTTCCTRSSTSRSAGPVAAIPAFGPYRDPGDADRLRPHLVRR